MMDIDMDLLQCFIMFLDKKASGEAAMQKKSAIKNENMWNKELAK